MAVDVSNDVSPDQSCRRQLEFSTGSSSGLGSSLGTEPSTACALVVDEAFVTNSTGCSPCSVDTGVTTTDDVCDEDDDASDAASTSDASDTSSCRSTVSAASNVPSVSLDALSVVAPATTVSTSMLQSVPVPGNSKVSARLFPDSISTIDF